MMEKADEVMKGTVFENDWYFYHDALSLMTSKDCLHWMKETNFNGKSIFDRWILPININKGTRYENTVCGNSPEFMPLDNSLNRDIQLSHDHHTIMTAHLPKDDIRRFSKATPVLIDRGIRRIWDNSEGTPSGRRVLQDIERATDAMLAVLLADGKMVPEIVNRNGHRNEKAGQSAKGNRNKEGSERKDWDKDQWLHPLVRDVVEERKLAVIQKYMDDSSDSSDEESELSDT